MKRREADGRDFAQLKSKIFWKSLGLVALAFVLICLVYSLFWRGRGGEWVISVFQTLLRMEPEAAKNLYQQLFRNNVQLIWLGAVMAVFLILFYLFLAGFTRYFNEINRGIDALLESGRGEIVLPPEMSAVEKKLNEVRRTLDRRAEEALLAEHRKNELVVYLAHDIRTPLTSVIGYLSLLDEVPEMPREQRAKYVHITLEKANRLEKLVNEFFEITRYNVQQITIEKEPVDLSYLLVQLADEFYPVLSANGNTVALRGDENLTVYGDPAKLARVFNNLLKNAAAYSYPQTEISITAEARDGAAVLTFQNHGPTIPPEKLTAVFDKFYRLDEARASNTGGAGLGLAIAKEIVALHGGTVTARSAGEITAFTVSLPGAVQREAAAT